MTLEDTSESRKDRELQNLRVEIDRLRGRLSLLSDISRRITSSLDPPTVLQEVVDAACELTGARYGALGVFDAPGRIQQFITHGVTPEERERIGALPQGLGIIGLLQHLQQPLRLANLSSHPRSIGFPPNHPPMKTFLGSPIRLGDEGLGNLYLAEKEGGEEFTPEDEDLLVLFAAQAAMAIRNARLYQRVEAERSRIDVILQTLSESEARYRSILDSTTAVIYVKDTGGRYILVNHQYENLFHVDREEIKGKTDYDIFPKEMADAFRASDRKVLEAGAPLEFEELAPHDDGLHTYISLKFPLHDSTGVPYAVCGISTDVTERKRMEEEVQMERQRLQVLIDTSPVGIVVVEGKDRKVILFNKELQRIAGFDVCLTESMVTYEPLITFLRPDGSIYNLEERPLQRALFRGETVRAEDMVYQAPDGRKIPVLYSATPIHSSGGDVIGAIALIQDITPLAEVEKLRSEFLGIVTHELRTPLTAIKGSAATVLGSKRPFDAEETRELFQIIDEQADRLRDLVDNILDMTRIEAGSLSVSPEAINLREVLEEAQTTFRRSGSPQEIQLYLPEGLPLVNADRRRVIQVLLNLLSNASKFSPAAAPIAIEVEYDAMHVTAHVRDLGRGIPREKLSHLFKKFSQVHEDSGRRLAGSGLGLAICKGIVEAHGGRIWADSSGEGQGATFSFTLPIAVENPPLPPFSKGGLGGFLPSDTSRRAEHLGRVSRAGERTRILAVDDEPQILRYLQRSLDEGGYQPMVTTDPTEVTKLVELEEPDLVLLDLMLPGTSGFKLLQRIREFSGVPVIFLTARDRDEDAVQALKMGADDYITKPFSPSELLARIEAALRRRVLPDQLEVRPSFMLNDLTINFAERRVAVGGQAVSLSATEYKLLYELATHAGMVLTHDQILQRVWGPEYSGETELVRSFIRNLRRKLGDDARNPRYIFTESQVGYRMPKP